MLDNIISTHKPTWPQPKIRPEIDELIESGATFAEIGRKINRSGDRVRRYTNTTGQYEKWKGRRAEILVQRRKEEQQLRQAWGGLVSTLKAIVDYLVHKEPFAVQKTSEFIQSYMFISRRRYSNELLIALFDRYEKAMNNGEKPSLEDLSNGLGIYPNAAGTISETVGLEPFYGSRERHAVPKGKKEAIRRAYGLEIPPTDIAYFLNLPYHVVAQNIRRMGKRAKIEPFIARFRGTPGRYYLTYRLASQIFEAQDLGFNENEIARLLGTNEAVVNHTIENRNTGRKYQDIIIHALKILYQDNNISRPYLVK